MGTGFGLRSASGEWSDRWNEAPSVMKPKRIRTRRRHDHGRTQHTTVGERGLEEFAERFLKLGLTTRPHATGDGDMDGHNQNRNVATAET